MTKEELKKIANGKGLKIDDGLMDKIVVEDDLDGVAGGYLGHDRFSAKEYSEAGVVWIHNILKKDQYFFDSYKISQAIAEGITDYYQETGKKLTLEEVKSRYSLP